jgi:hypothetical protein
MQYHRKIITTSSIVPEPFPTVEQQPFPTLVGLYWLVVYLDTTFNHHLVRTPKAVWLRSILPDMERYRPKEVCCQALRDEKRQPQTLTLDSVCAGPDKGATPSD